MNSIAVSMIVFASVFGAAVCGILLSRALPQHHLHGDSKEVVRMGMGLVATMAALVLGLLISSAKNFYDAQSTELTQISARIILLDRLLAHYGPETKEVRDLLRSAVADALDRAWPQERRQSSGPGAPSAKMEALIGKIQALSPKDDRQRALQAQALSSAVSFAEIRWLMYEQDASSLSGTMLAILVSWLVTIFISFGLFAPRNGDHRFVRCCVVSFRRDLFDPGDVHAFRRTDSDPERPAPRYSCAAWPVSVGGATPEKVAECFGFGTTPPPENGAARGEGRIRSPAVGRVRQQSLICRRLRT